MIPRGALDNAERRKDAPHPRCVHMFLEVMLVNEHDFGAVGGFDSPNHLSDPMPVVEVPVGAPPFSGTPE